METVTTTTWSRSKGVKRSQCIQGRPCQTRSGYQLLKSNASRKEILLVTTRRAAVIKNVESSDLKFYILTSN